MKRLILVALIFGLAVVVGQAQGVSPGIQPAPVPPGTVMPPVSAVPVPPQPVLPPVTPVPVPPQPVFPPVTPVPAPPQPSTPPVPPVPFLPRLNVTVNGQNAGVLVVFTDNVRIDYTIKANGYTGEPVDVWFLMNTPFGLFFYDGSGPYSGWSLGTGAPFASGPLGDNKGTALDSMLPLGGYDVFLGLDKIANGRLDLGALKFVDNVDFTVIG